MGTRTWLRKGQNPGLGVRVGLDPERSGCARVPVRKGEPLTTTSNQLSGASIRDKVNSRLAPG